MFTLWPTRTVRARCTQQPPDFTGYPRVEGHADAGRVNCTCGIYACLKLSDLDPFRRVIVAGVRLHGQLVSSIYQPDPASTVVAEAATIVGPIYVPPSPWAGKLSSALAARYWVPMRSSSYAGSSLAGAR